VADLRLTNLGDTTLDLTPLRRSLTALRKVVCMDLEDDIVRDAAVKRFEFTYELS